MFKSKESRKNHCLVNLYGTEGKELWTLGSIYGEAQNWARCLSDMPANKMTPVDLAQVLFFHDYSRLHMCLISTLQYLLTMENF